MRLLFCAFNLLLVVSEVLQVCNYCFSLPGLHGGCFLGVSDGIPSIHAFVRYRKHIIPRLWCEVLPQAEGIQDRGPHPREQRRGGGSLGNCLADETEPRCQIRRPSEVCICLRSEGFSSGSISGSISGLNTRARTITYLVLWRNTCGSPRVAWPFRHHRPPRRSDGDGP